MSGPAPLPGTVLISAAVGTRHTDPTTMATTVTLEFDFQGMRSLSGRSRSVARCGPTIRGHRVGAALRGRTDPGRPGASDDPLTAGLGQYPAGAGRARCDVRLADGAGDR